MLQTATLSLYRCCYGCQKALVSEEEGSVVGIDNKRIETVNKLSSCARCHIAAYCSQTCQRADWQKHKPNCVSPEASLDSSMLHRTILFYFQKKYVGKSLNDCAREVRLGYAKLIISSAVGSGNSPEIDEDRFAVEGTELFRSFKMSLSHEKLDGYSEVGKKHHFELVDLCERKSNAFIVQVQKVNLNGGSTFQSIGNVMYQIGEIKHVRVATTVDHPSPILVFQQQWAFASVDSEKYTLKTSSASVCFVMSFTYGQEYAALAHIDCDTDVGSL